MTTSTASPCRRSTGSSCRSGSRCSPRKPPSRSRRCGGRPGGFDERPDRWLTHLAQAAEWFPLLGLIGTVAAILQTFSSITPGSQPTPQEIIKKYAPAITATGSGLFMALANILPAWMVVTGRDLIRSLAGSQTASPIVPLTPASPASLDNPDAGGRP